MEISFKFDTVKDKDEATLMLSYVLEKLKEQEERKPAPVPDPKPASTPDPKPAPAPDPKPAPDADLEELRAKLTAMGVSFSPRLRKSGLEILLKEAEEKQAEEKQLEAALETVPVQPKVDIPNETALKVAAIKWCEWKSENGSNPRAQEEFQKMLQDAELVAASDPAKIAFIPPEKRAEAIELFSRREA